MPYDRFMICPLNTGLENDVRPFLIPDDAFQELNNAYIFRGRLRKRFGTRLMIGSSTATDGYQQLLSRVRIQVATTTAGAASGTVPGTIFKIGQMFSIGTNIFTVYQTGTPAAMYTTDGATIATYNTTTGAYNFTGVLNGGLTVPDLTPVYFYPAEPIMGLPNYEVSSINDEPVFAFDTQFAYQFTASGWSRLTGGADTWTGNNANFFWAVSARGASASNTLLFVTNYKFGATAAASDTMRYWNGSTWTAFQPRFTSTVATNTVMTARIIVYFKSRLVLLNVVENTGSAPDVNTSYVNRARWSWNGNPIDTTAFYEDIDGKGSYQDAPTKEAIITAQFLKDRLIVYFERSTWELAYTGNDIQPFVWQKINTELGAESTFSQVPFDKVVYGVGNVGIHACNGTNVERIDNKIPDEVFDIHNADNGIERVYGIRDYFSETVYWTFPSVDQTAVQPYPNRVLVFNYKNNSWAFNDDSFTAFGYYQNVSGITWADSISEWQEEIDIWGSGSLQAKYRNVIAGNQEGYVVIVDPNESRNAPGLQITNITAAAFLVTVYIRDHNLRADDYILIEYVTGTGTMTSLNDQIFVVSQVIDEHTIEIIVPSGVTGIYSGGGTASRVSRIDARTKQFNFYQQEGRNAYIAKVDFLVDKTTYGEIAIDYFVSTSLLSMVSNSQATGAIVGDSILETSAYALVPFEEEQTRVWHPVYLQADGECVQLRIYFNDAQMTTPTIVLSDFEMHAMTFYAQRAAFRLQ